MFDSDTQSYFFKCQWQKITMYCSEWLTTPAPTLRPHLVRVNYSCHMNLNPSLRYFKINLHILFLLYCGAVLQMQKVSRSIDTFMQMQV